ncbi:hypothetical protein M5D96_010076, partial [Drosophila gunungcola]
HANVIVASTGRKYKIALSIWNFIQSLLACLQHKVLLVIHSSKVVKLMSIMKTKTTSVLFILWCSLFFHADCAVWHDDQLQYDIMEKALGNLTNVIVKCKDNRVKYVPLQENMISVERSLRYYKRTAKNELNEIKALRSGIGKAYNDYFGTVHEWCVSSNSSFGVFIENINDETLTDKETSILWSMVLDSTSYGLKVSLEALMKVQAQMTNLKDVSVKIAICNLFTHFRKNT